MKPIYLDLIAFWVTRAKILDAKLKGVYYAPCESDGERGLLPLCKLGEVWLRNADPDAIKEHVIFPDHVTEKFLLEKAAGF